MGSIVALADLVAGQQVWRASEPAPAPAPGLPSQVAHLDEALPSAGWPRGALTEVLLPADGVGELSLVLPALAQLTQAGQWIALVAPPYAPCVAGWRAGGVDMARVLIVQACERQALWAAEQCLRSGSCAAVLCWSRTGDDRALRRLQVAADTGRAVGFLFRDRKFADNPSPAALRVEVAAQPTPTLRVRKCRGAHPPAAAFPLSLH